MRDINRIEPMLKVIETIWKANPDLRLGQLLLNVVNNSSFMYYLEDDELLSALEVMYLPVEETKTSKKTPTVAQKKATRSPEEVFEELSNLSFDYMYNKKK